MQVDDVPQTYGFEVSRFVEATDESQASDRALEQLRQDPKIVRAALNSATQPPAFRVTFVEKLGPLKRAPARQPGFAFYPQRALDATTVELWRRACTAAKAYRAGQMTWDNFMSEFGGVQPANDDDDLGELIDLIEHEPARHGLGAINESEFNEYLASVDGAIWRIESRVGAA